MDLLAERLGMSPLELRRQNLLRDGDRFATGEVMHDVRFEECLQAAADAVGYEADPRGKGLCVLLKGMQTPSRAAVSRRAHAGRLRRPVARRARWARACAARSSSWPPSCSAASPARSSFRDPDTDSSPFDTRTTSSRSTHMMGRALAVAAEDLHSNGGQRGFGEVRNEGGLDPDTGQGIASTHWHQGAASARVSVDEETGQGRASSTCTASVYAGRVVNRPGAELQNEGSMIMGLGTRAVRGDRVRRRPGHERQPVRLQRPRARATCPRLHARAHRARGGRGPRAGGDGAAAGPAGDRQRAAVARRCASTSCRSRPSACSTPSTPGRPMNVRRRAQRPRARRSSASRRDCCSTCCAPAG